MILDCLSERAGRRLGRILIVISSVEGQRGNRGKSWIRLRVGIVQQSAIAVRKIVGGGVISDCVSCLRARVLVASLIFRRKRKKARSALRYL